MGKITQIIYMAKGRARKAQGTHAAELILFLLMKISTPAKKIMTAVN